MDRDSVVPVSAIRRRWVLIMVGFAGLQGRYKAGRSMCPAHTPGTPVVAEAVRQAEMARTPAVVVVAAAAF
jgi:hypothetical protein